MIKVVFFDLDDTLYDHAGIVETTLHKLRERLPQIAQHSDAEVLELYHRLLEQYHKHYIDGTWPFEEAHRRRWQAMLDHWAIADVDPEEMRLYWREQYFANQKLVTGARELLEALRSRGLAIGIVTNNSVSDQVAKLRDCKIDHLIDHLVISEEAGYGKPDERIYAIALERACVNPAEAMMIGDHWENDVLAPSKLGIKAVWFNRRSASQPDPSILTITSLEPVSEAIAAIFREGLR